MTTPSDSPADRIAEIRARVEALNAGDDSARYAARAVLEVNAPSDIPWLLERLGVEGLVAKLADENCRAAEAEAERLRADLEVTKGYADDKWQRGELEVGMAALAHDRDQWRERAERAESALERLYAIGRGE